MFGFFKKRQKLVELKNRWAGVYRYGGRMIVHAGGLTIEGIGIVAEPFASCASDDPAAVANLVRNAIAHSRGGLQFPEDRRAYFRPFLKEAGVTSWRPLETSALLIDVIEGDGKLKLLPHRTGGTRGDKKGFQPILERERCIPADLPPEELWQEVLSAFNDCIPFDG